MPTDRTPGVWVDEVPSGSMPLATAPTAVAAFVGFTAEAPLDRPDVDPSGEVPRMVTSWAQYEELYGGFTNDALLPQAVFGFFDNGGSRCYIVRIPDRSLEKAAAAVELRTAEDWLDQWKQDIRSLAIAEDVTMVMIPDLLTAASKGMPPGEYDDTLWRGVQQALVSHCESKGDRLAILDAPPGKNPQEVREWRDLANLDSKCAAMYYPWLEVDNPVGTTADGNASVFVPPCGHLAGIWARTDEERGVWTAPANEPVRGILGLQTKISRLEQELLNPMGINVIRPFGPQAIKVWGARTLSVTDPSWKYINVRRLFNMVETTIMDGTQWVVFEPNDETLWERVGRTVDAFLLGLWRQGALVGASPDEAFFVKCDAENNPPESRNEAKLIIEVGLAPVLPAEFVIFRISQQAQGV